MFLFTTIAKGIHFTYYHGCFSVMRVALLLPTVFVLVKVGKIKRAIHRLVILAREHYLIFTHCLKSKRFFIG